MDALCAYSSNGIEGNFIGCWTESKKNLQSERCCENEHCELMETRSRELFVRNDCHGQYDQSYSADSNREPFFDWDRRPYYSEHARFRPEFNGFHRKSRNSAHHGRDNNGYERRTSSENNMGQADHTSDNAGDCTKSFKKTEDRSGKLQSNVRSQVN